MRFCDKLAKVRKNNNLSQEVFADKLGVSRQAVSKWESGSSYPDMEKIIQMTKILNCTLEDLLDDGTLGKNKTESKINFNNYLQDFLKFITTSYNMFCSMTFKQKIKCMFEMFVIFIILIITAALVSATINDVIFIWVSKIPVIGYSLREVLNSLITIVLLIIGIIIFIHLFKIRYLDYFITIEDSSAKEKTIEDSIDKKEKDYYKEKGKEKIIIRDPKHSELSIFNLLLKVILLIIKMFAVMFVIPIIFMFVFTIVLSVISVYHTIYAIFFLFIAIILIALAVICYDVTHFIYNFVFDRKINFKNTFLIAIISLIVIGISSGLTFINIISYKYEDNINGLETKTKTENITISENTRVILPYSDIEYVIDENRESVKIEITYLKGTDYIINHDTSEEYDYYNIYSKGINPSKLYKFALKDIKKHVLRSYNSSTFIKAKVYVNNEEYNILKNNN